jgi:diketogulonate reductase-like aldo/keto reductase
MNPIWQQKRLTEFCKDKGIHLTAYSPLGGQISAFEANPVLQSEVLQEVAKARGKSVAQVPTIHLNVSTLKFSSCSNFSSQFNIIKAFEV